MGDQSEFNPKSDKLNTAVPDLEPYEEIEDDEEDEDFEEDEGEDSDAITPEARMRTDRANMESLFSRLSTERVPVRVHDVIIKGNTKTKDALIEAEVEAVFRDATSFQQLLSAAGVANARLQGLDIFESVNITLDAGPPELPGTANVVIEVSEVKNPLTGDFGVYSKPEVSYV